MDSEYPDHYRGDVKEENISCVLIQKAEKGCGKDV